MSSGVLHKFYCSSKWLLFREQIILERGTICEECGRHIFVSQEIQIHHTPIELTEDNYTDVMISLNPDNVKLICSRCHNKAHGRFCGGHRKERGIYLVCGAPLSGKSTYVRESMAAGDLVVDMDMLYHAMSYQELFNKPDNLKYNVFAVKNLLIDNIKTRYGNFNSAWIVGGYANKVERERVARSLGAEVTILECTKEECYRRLDKVRDYRQNCKGEWRRYIDEWYDTFSP